MSSPPIRTPDSLDNATEHTWRISAEFSSGQRQNYEQQPETLSNFGVMSRKATPVLSHLAVSTDLPVAVTYSLDAPDLVKLHRASIGGLKLVLYDEGIACLSPALQRTLEKELNRQTSTRESYFSLLRTHKDAALQWTQAVLKQR